MALERAGRKQRDLEKDLGEDLKAVEFRLFELSKCEARSSKGRRDDRAEMEIRRKEQRGTR
jgi:hypothetical protein